jgi:NADH-quinone oxidoreductase subunit A
MPGSYLPLLIVIAVGGGLSLIILLLSHMFGPRKKERIKLAPYECGLDPLGDARGRIHIKYFIIAILFIIFDLDGISIIPWALLVRELGWLGLMEIGIFVSLMIFGLVYAVKKGAFKWE